MSLAPDVEARMKREHREKYARLAQTLGEDSLAGLVRDLVPRVVQALAAGDEHLNTIALATWDSRAGMVGVFGPTCCGKSCGTKFCPHCGKQLRQSKPDGSLWPYSELRETVRDRSLPWHSAPGLSLAERVCVLKYVAEQLARATQPGDSNQ